MFKKIFNPRHLFTCRSGQMLYDWIDLVFSNIVFVAASGAGPPLDMLNFIPKSASGPP